jgi:deoxyribonuclease-4
LTDFDNILDEFEKIIGLKYLKVLHINDSKNEKGAHKDRHENIGYGKIGFKTICDICHNKRVENIPKLLETPVFDDYDSYGIEIKMIKSRKFTD